MPMGYYCIYRFGWQHFYLFLQCVKSVRIRGYSGPHSDWIRTRITPNTDNFHAVFKMSIYFTFRTTSQGLLQFIWNQYITNQCAWCIWNETDFYQKKVFLYGSISTVKSCCCFKFIIGIKLSLIWMYILSLTHWACAHALSMRLALFVLFLRDNILRCCG